MTKSEAISWFRIQEMFRFQSFHMYGIIGTSFIVGVLALQFFKKKQVQSLDGEPLKLCPKERTITRYLLGGTIFGLGWALTGACPGPMYTLVGNGYAAVLVVVASAVVGTFFYGLFKEKLPH